MGAIRKLKITASIGGIVLFATSIIGTEVEASDFNAEKVMKEMKPEERQAFFAGIIEGLAIARYHKDGKKKDGMACIYDFYYKDNQNLTVILDAFQKYPSYPPGSIIDVLTKRKCGE